MESTKATDSTATPKPKSEIQRETGSQNENSSTDLQQGSGGQIKGGNPIILSEFTFDRITVKVPDGWRKEKIGGDGDWTGWQFVNPKDPNQEVIMKRSACVGCIMDPQLYTQGIMKVNPMAAIPQNATDHFLFNHGLSVGYSYMKSSNPNKGNGVLTVSPKSGDQGFDGDQGYAQVEVFLPDTEKSVATEILNSFQLK